MTKSANAALIADDIIRHRHIGCQPFASDDEISSDSQLPDYLLSTKEININIFNYLHGKNSDYRTKSVEAEHTPHRENHSDGELF